MSAEHTVSMEREYDRSIEDEGSASRRPRRRRWMVVGLIAVGALALAGAAGWAIRDDRPIDDSVVGVVTTTNGDDTGFFCIGGLGLDAVPPPQPPRSELCGWGFASDGLVINRDLVGETVAVEAVSGLQRGGYQVYLVHRGWDIHEG